MARRQSLTFIAGGTVVLAALAMLPFRGQSQSQAVPIHFSYRPIAFTLNNGETETRYVPETMAGGVAVFDYNNDGRLDIFFTNGAEMPSLRKTSPKYWNRLFRNNGEWHLHGRDGGGGTGRQRLRYRRRRGRLQQRWIRGPLRRGRSPQRPVSEQR